MSPIKNEHTSELNLNALGLMYGHKFITFFYQNQKTLVHHHHFLQIWHFKWMVGVGAKKKNRRI